MERQSLWGVTNELHGERLEAALTRRRPVMAVRRELVLLALVVFAVGTEANYQSWITNRSSKVRLPVLRNCLHLCYPAGLVEGLQEGR